MEACWWEAVCVCDYWKSAQSCFTSHFVCFHHTLKWVNITRTSHTVVGLYTIQPVIHYINKDVLLDTWNERYVFHIEYRTERRIRLHLVSFTRSVHSAEWDHAKEKNWLWLRGKITFQKQTALRCQLCQAFIKNLKGHCQNPNLKTNNVTESLWGWLFADI